jgi:phosphoglycerol transferase MdoB-like AlkP superfamily enzyme
MPRLAGVAQAAELGASVKAASLLTVFVVAKVAVLWGRSNPPSGWSLVAYVWQDVAVALLFAAVVWVLRNARGGPALSSLLYWLLAGYAALNVPVGIVLSTPLTWPMLRATSGTLADSIFLYATWRNILLVLLTLVTAAALPSILRVWPSAPALSMTRATAFAAALLLIAVGPAATSRVDTVGLHRNVLIALATSALPRVEAAAAGGVWTVSPFEQHEADDFSHLRGIAAGRNVILVSLESTGSQYLRLYGGTYDLTPSLDRLARHALVFDNAYAVYPESIKGLFSVLCSTYPAFDTPPAAYAHAPCRSIASLLDAAGYRSALFHSGRFGYLGMESIINGRGFHTLQDAGDIGGNHESSFGVDEPAAVAKILSWIDGVPRNQRFFVTYMPIAGHHPYERPDPGPFPAHDEIGRYRNALHYGDQSLGTLMEGIRVRGLENDTLWIVLGDHGEALGQHEGNYGHTFFLYEENVRVPLLIAAPGAITRAHRSRTMVSLVDTAPTLLDILGLPIPREHQGRSALEGESHMALFFTDYSLGLVGLRDGRWKFIHELESRRSKLYDLVHDPREANDLLNTNSTRAAAYERILRSWSAAQKSYLRERGSGHE